MSCILFSYQRNHFTGNFRFKYTGKKHSATIRNNTTHADARSWVPDSASCSTASRTHVRHTEDSAPSPSFCKHQTQQWTRLPQRNHVVEPERLPNRTATLTLTLTLFCKEWKQISVLLVAVRHGSLPVEPMFLRTKATKKLIAYCSTNCLVIHFLSEVDFGQFHTWPWPSL